MVPDRVAVQDPPLAGILPGADGGGDPAFESGQPLVAVGQRADGDQDAAQVGEGLARGQLVEDLVSQPAAVAAEAGKKVADLRPRHPGQGGVGPLDSADGLVERGQVAADGARLVTEEVAGLLVEDAPLAWPRAELPGLLAGPGSGPRSRDRG